MSTSDLVKSMAGESKETKPPFGTGSVPPAVLGSRSERLFFFFFPQDWGLVSQEFCLSLFSLQLVKSLGSC